MKKAILPLIAPMLSVFILTLGNGYYTTLTSLSLSSAGVSESLVGVVSSAFFLGLLVGSYHTQFLINRVGHIRAYAFFTSMMVVAVLLQGLFFNIWSWAVLRLIAGYDLAALFIIIESWLVSGADETIRGSILGFYLFTYYISQAVSQLLVKVHLPIALFGFTIIAALAALSVLPVSMTRSAAPMTDSPEIVSPRLLWKKVPLGLVAGFIAGAILAILYTLLPVLLTSVGQSRSQVADLIFVLIIAGAMGQIPIGKISDKLDRRWVILAVTVMTIFSSLTMVFLPWHFNALFIFCILTGVFAFAIYPLSISHTSDYVSKNMAVPAIALLTLFYGGGSVLGPFIGGVVIQYGGNRSLFIFLALIGLGLSLYTLYRIIKREPAEESSRVQFTTVIPEAQIPSEEVVEMLENQPNDTAT